MSKQIVNKINFYLVAHYLRVISGCIDENSKLSLRIKSSLASQSKWFKDDDGKPLQGYTIDECWDRYINGIKNECFSDKIRQLYLSTDALIDNYTLLKDIPIKSIRIKEFTPMRDYMKGLISLPLNDMQLEKARTEIHSELVEILNLVEKECDHEIVKEGNLSSKDWAVILYYMRPEYQIEGESETDMAKRFHEEKNIDYASTTFKGNYDNFKGLIKKCSDPKASESEMNRAIKRIEKNLKYLESHKEAYQSAIDEIDNMRLEMKYM